MTIHSLIVEGLAQDCASLEAEQIEAIAESATYRQMLLVALEGWEIDRRRADAAEQRLRQVLGQESWHREQSGDS